MIMYDTPSKHIRDSIIILNIISFGWIGPQNMMDGAFISPESTYLAYSDHFSTGTAEQKGTGAKYCEAPKNILKTEELEVSWPVLLFLASRLFSTPFVGF